MFNEPKTEKINLFGRDLLLSERTAGDVHKLISFSKQSPEKDYQDILLESAIALSDSLKYNIKITNRFRLIKRFILKKKTSTQYLLINLSANDIFSLAKKVYELEGIVFNEKKKTANHSRDQKQE